MPAKGLTERDYEEMERMYTTGTTMAAIAAWFGVTRQWVQMKLRQRGVNTRMQVLTRMEERERRLRYRTCEVCGVVFDRKVKARHQYAHSFIRDGDPLIIAAYQSGTRIADIATQFDTTVGHIHRVINRAGVPHRKGSRRAPTMAETRSREAKILELRSLGLSYPKIAKRVGVSATLVGKIGRKAGI